MIILAIKLAVIAFCYSDKLTEPDMLLGPLKYRITLLITSFPWLEWVFKPLILCPHCVAGQMALWTWIFIKLGHTWIYTAIEAGFFISLTILLIDVLLKFKRWAN